MSFTKKITLAYKEFARKREDRKLVRQMERELPDMMADMKRMVESMRASNCSILNLAESMKNYNPRALDHLLGPPPGAVVEAPAAVEPAPPPFDPADCIVLQNPITVARQPIRVRSL